MTQRARPSLRLQIADAIAAFRERLDVWREREPLTFEIGDYHQPCGAIYDGTRPHYCVRDLMGRCNNTSCASYGFRRLLSVYGACSKCGTGDVRERQPAWPLSLVLTNAKLAAVVSLDAERERRRQEIA